MILAVLTTVVAFLPLAFVEGTMGKFMFNMPVVVISILLFSLVESLLILPAHLATMKSVDAQEADRTRRWYGRPRTASTRPWPTSSSGVYRPTLDFALVHRPVVIALAVATLLVTVGFVAGGHIKFTFMPKVDADNLVAALTLPQGTTVEEAERAVDAAGGLAGAGARGVRRRARPGGPVGDHARGQPPSAPSRGRPSPTPAAAAAAAPAAPTWWRSTPSC